MLYLLRGAHAAAMENPLSEEQQAFLDDMREREEARLEEEQVTALRKHFIDEAKVNTLLGAVSVRPPAVHAVGSRLAFGCRGCRCCPIATAHPTLRLCVSLCSRVGLSGISSAPHCTRARAAHQQPASSLPKRAPSRTNAASPRRTSAWGNAWALCLGR